MSDQNVNQGTWVSLGVFAFAGTAGENLALTASSQASVQGASADAVKWVGAGPAAPQIVVSTNSLLVDENNSNSFDVQLSMNPGGPVTVNIAKLGGGDADLSSPTSINFDSGNWNMPAPVTVSAADDPDTTDGTATFELTAAGMNNQIVVATENDDDAPPPPSEFIVDNLDPGFTTTGTWHESAALDEHAGSSFYNKIAGTTATWTPLAGSLVAGNYEVFVWYSGTKSNGSPYDRDSAAQYEVHHNGMTHTMILDQDVSQGTWVSLGTFTFSGAGGEFLRLTVSTQADVQGASADVARWVRLV